MSGATGLEDTSIASGSVIAAAAFVRGTWRRWLHRHDEDLITKVIAELKEPIDEMAKTIAKLEGILYDRRYRRRWW